MGIDGRATQINEHKFHIHMQMKYEAYYTEIDQRTEAFLWKFGFTEWT